MNVHHATPIVYAALKLHRFLWIFTLWHKKYKIAQWNEEQLKDLHKISPIVYKLQRSRFVKGTWMSPAAIKLKSGKIFKSHILTPPHPRAMWRQGSVRNPWMNLQSKFGYCKTTQTLNIALFSVPLGHREINESWNLESCLYKAGRILRTDGRADGRTNRQTDGRTDDPNTKCPRRTFQAGGIKMFWFFQRKWNIALTKLTLSIIIGATSSTDVSQYRVKFISIFTS